MYITVVLLSLACTLLATPWVNAQDTHFKAVPGAEKIQRELLELMMADPAVTRQLDTEKPYRIIVNLRPSSHATPQGADGLAQLQQRVQAAQDTILQTRKRGTLTILNRYKNIYSFSAQADREAILDLATIGDVDFIERLPVMQKMDLQSHPLTGVDRVHATGFTGQGVTIAMIDDGIDAAHPAFGGDAAWPNDKIIGGYDFADNDSDPRNDCPQQSHGTAVAGVAAGNGGGVLGTAPDAQIVLLKTQSAQQCGSEQLDGDWIAALDWIISHREQFSIDIISLSLGGQAFSSALLCNYALLALRQLFDLAHDAGVIIFAAAGNEAQLDAISLPACIDSVISVGAVYDADLGPTEFSICSDPVTGPDHIPCYANRADYLDILAPAHCATTASTTGGEEPCFGGTSASAPFAAGVAATLLEAAKAPLNNDTMRRLLVESGVAVTDASSGLVIPRIDALAAHHALALAPDVIPTAPCEDCTLYTGTLADTYDVDLQPDGTYYFSPAGTHNGWLVGPDQTNFDLYLLQWSGFYWMTVATSHETNSQDFITYQGTAGHYAWFVYSQEGRGSYHFWLQRP